MSLSISNSKQSLAGGVSTNAYDFCFWNGIYNDLQFAIFYFCSLDDFVSLRKVNKIFKDAVNNCQIAKVEYDWNKYTLKFAFMTTKI